jgi:dTDP-4-dehydrorhamnose reductase
VTLSEAMPYLAALDRDLGELARRFAGRHEVVAFGRAELDVTDAGAVRRAVEGERPGLVVNCTVLGVDECEREPGKARAVNVEAPASLADAAREAGAEFLHFSTNYVFDGREHGRPPYTFEDEARPVNVYGRTKLEGELAAVAASPRTYVVRTSWVFGPGKATFLGAAHRELLAGRSLSAIRDTWASATYVADLAARVEEITAGGRHGTYHVVNGGVCSYYEFALEAARLSGLDAETTARLVVSVSEDDKRREAERPRYTPMRCLLSERAGLAPLRGWRAALAEYVETDAAGA